MNLNIGKKYVSFLTCLFILTLIGCTNNKDKPNEKEDETTPVTINDCLPEEVEAIDILIGEGNFDPSADEVKERWKGLNISWQSQGENLVVETIRILEDADFRQPIEMILSKSGPMLEYLDSLIIKSNQISKLSIRDQSQLRYVELSGDTASPLETIDVANNSNMNELIITNFPKVTTLKLGAAKMDLLHIGDIPSLASFNISGIMSEQPDEYGNYEILVHNTIKKVEIRGNMSQLDYVYLHGKEIEIFDINKSIVPNLKTLTLTSNKLKGKLELKMLESLEEVRLGSNELSSISFDDCPKLRTVDLSNNKRLVDFSISDGTSLRVLALSDVSIETLDISTFKSLKNLSATNSKISKLIIADSHGTGPQLEIVALNNNQLTSFVYPAEVMKNMSIININDNKIAEIDLSALHHRLERILMNNNNISNIILPKRPFDRNLFDGIEAKNNNIDIETLISLYELCDEPINPSKFSFAPQLYLDYQDLDSKTVDYSHYVQYINEGICSLCVVRWNQESQKWDYLEDGVDHIREGNIVKLSTSPKGKYRIGLSGTYGFALGSFSPQEPYILGELNI